MTQHVPAIKTYYHFKAALLHKAWLSAVYIGVDQNGIVQYLSADQPRDGKPVEEVDGILLPGFQNGHSHAFQYGMAGLAEKHKPRTDDDFWSWREAMYQCALSFNPDQIQAVATALYIEMLKRGYTHVAEFHYLHHDKDGKPYDNAAEISVALIAAAAVAGIRITLVPVFYQNGGFGKTAQPRQRRFIFKTIDEYFRLLELASKGAGQLTTAQMGYGVHSLRAAQAKDVVEIATTGPANLPFHIHAAEQLMEVEDSLVHLNQRPVEWLLNNLELNERFNIVHCTHLTDFEVDRLAASRANVVLCPGTEGNLGDGIFRLREYQRNNGNWCIGTDSHISLNPLEDLRWLDYGQRLTSHKRNTFNEGAGDLIDTAFRCGQLAMGNKRSSYFEIGKPLDGVVYDGNHPLFSSEPEGHLLNKILYNADSRFVKGTLVNGEWIVRDGRHNEDESSDQSFREALKSITIDN